jgi:hypothetical protein
MMLCWKPNKAISATSTTAAATGAIDEAGASIVLGTGRSPTKAIR